MPVPRNPFTTETSSARFTGSSILAIKIRSIFISSKSSTVSHSIWGPLGKRIYGHSRFCNTDFDDKLACLNLSGV
ncbi:integrase [Klebsiella pneumoniae]|nr:integrase [Klebsiella pneumoniae]MBZ7079805.1 integrase [Klebsiella pneumoniae]